MRKPPREWYCEAYLKFKVLAEIAWVKLKATAEDEAVGGYHRNCSSVSPDILKIASVTPASR
jgi:hypothetical protein